MKFDIVETQVETVKFKSKKARADKKRQYRAKRQTKRGF